MSDAETAATTAQDPLKTVADAMEAAVQAAKDGAGNARDAAERFMPEAANFLSKVAYRTCYAVSYGVVFPTAFVANVIPKENAFVHGLIDGAQAARDMVDEMKAKKATDAV